MSASSTRSIVVPARQWTQVVWQAGVVAVTYQFVVQSRAGTPVTVDWQWFSAGLPPFWAGNFVGMARITLVASIYTSLNFYTPMESVVSIRPV